MKRLVKGAIIGLAILSTGVNAGGKYVTPAEAVVIPVSGDYSAWYLGAGLVRANFHACGHGCTYEDVTYGAMLRGGYDFNAYFGVEARAMRTFMAEGPLGGVPLQHIGLYLKPQYPISERISIYGLLGYGYTENLGNGARLGYFDNESGLSAGIGLEYDLSGKEGDLDNNAHYDRAFDGHADQGRGWSLFVDYQRLLIKSDAPDMDIISAGARYDF